MDELWKIRAEIEIQPGELDLEPEYTTGFMNIVTWANSEESVAEKISTYFGTFQWRLLLIDEASPIKDPSGCGPEIQEMIERAEQNPNAIILGTFHAYPSTLRRRIN
ncbi:MAG: hypothetical protein ACLPLZ_08505 [Terracidiphilus sp.]